MKKFLTALCMFFLLTAFSGCAVSPPADADGETNSIVSTASTPVSETSTIAPSPSATPTPTPDPAAERSAAIDAYIGGMTLEEKAASLFWVRPDQLDGTSLTFTEATARALDDFPVSGVALFGGNIHDEAQVRALTAAFRTAGGPGFVITTDEEGGRVSRLGGLGEFPRTPAMGRLKDQQTVYDAMFAVGARMRDWGFNLDLAPVCDVLTQPGNTVIGDRAFGQDAGTVSNLASEAARGLLDGGVQPCLKHFPGHGGTVGDSHTGAVYLPYDLAHLRTVEWPPFTAGITAGARIVMAGHIALPEVTGDDTPGSLSYAIVTGFLRGELGFEGLIVTDAMDMKAIAVRWDAGEAAVRALLAGCDVVLLPENIRIAIDGVVQAVRDGRLDEARVDEAIRRRMEIFWE